MNPETEELQPARALDGVIGTALALAQEELGKHGALMPFAVVLENDAATQRRIETGDDAPEEGEPALRLVMVAPEGEDDDEIDGEQTLAELVQAVRAQRDDLVAAALVSDVTLLEGEYQDAIHVEAEDIEGQLVSVLQPYRLGDEPEWADLLGDGDVTARIWNEG